MLQKGILFSCLMVLISSLAFGQDQSKIVLKQADRLKGREDLRIVIGDVLFVQDDIEVYCDSAYQYIRRNEIECFGNVRVLQGDSMTLTSNRLLYNGNTKIAHFRGNVFLTDETMRLYTDALDYNTETRNGDYTTGGKIIDEFNTLTSEIGHYNADTNTFDFREDVKLVNTKENFTLLSDHLLYNTNTKIATFMGPSEIVSPDGVVYTDEGEYNTETKESDLRGTRNKVESGTYILEGDRIIYSEGSDRGTAIGNVEMLSEEEDVIVTGQKAFYWGNLGISKVFNAPVMKSPFDGDTLYLTADTLVSLERPEENIKKLLAYNDVKVFREDLQAVCDSLVYDFSDSTIYMYNDPVMWSEGNQITADSMRIFLVNDKIDRMVLKKNSFIISRDTLKNFNQVAGRDMTAFFKNDTLRHVTVKGNSESVYFALEGDSVVMGMNKVICSDMEIYFNENKLESISFLTKPDGRFIPPHEIQRGEMKLKGFSWRLNDRPVKKEVLHLPLQ